MRKWLKWIGVICLIPIVLTILLAVLLYLPPVQNWVVQQATRYASKETGMEIGIQRIRLTYPLDLSLRGIEAVNTPDTLLTLDHLSVRVNPFRITKRIVGVESLSVEGLQIKTGSFIEGMEIEGYVSSLSAKADYINLTEEKATLNSAMLSDASLLLRIDSLSQDTTASAPLNWRLTLENVSLDNVAFSMQMPEDSLSLSTVVTNARLNGGTVDLGQSIYAVSNFSLQASELIYDGNEAEPTPGLDPMHIGFSNLKTSVDSIYYSADRIRADINTFTLKERSGLMIESLTGQVKTDSIRISIPNLTLKTSHSEMELHASVPWSTLDVNSNEKMRALLMASIGKDDILTLVPDLPEDFKVAYPDDKMKLTAGIEGNMDKLFLRQLEAELPGALTMKSSGEITAVMDSVRRGIDMQISAQSENLDFVLAYLSPDQRNGIRIPSGIGLNGMVRMADQHYQADLTVRESDGVVEMAATYLPKIEDYNLSLRVDSLEPIHFLPNDSILWVAASLQAEGKGTDPLSASTWTSIKGEVSKVRYGDIALSGVQLTASLKENKANIELNSPDSLAKMNILFDGTLTEELCQGMFIMDVDTINLQGLNLVEDKFITSFHIFAEGKTNLKEYNQLDVSLGNWEIIVGESRRQRFKPKMLTLKAHSNADAAQISLSSGDFSFVAAGNASLEKLMGQFNLIAKDLDRQMETDSAISVAELQPFLPEMTLSINAAKDNPVFNILNYYYMGFNRFSLDASTSPDEGINLDMNIYAAYRDTFLLDTVRAKICPDSLGLNYSANVIKKRYRQQSPFNAQIKGSLREKYIDAEVLYKNHANETGVLLGASVAKESEAYRIRLFPEDPVVAFNTFSLNPDNYILFRNEKDIEANVRFEGLENASLWLHTIDEGDTYPEQHIELNHINLDVVSTGFHQLPNMKGILSADLKYAPMDETFLVVADANIDDLYYENGRVGELMFNAVYLPLEGSEHQVDAHFYHDREEIIAATALYQAGKKDKINGALDVLQLPLPMINPFIPEDMAELSGKLNGHMSIEGTSSAPKVNGSMQLDTASVYIGMADSHFRFDPKPIEVNNNIINFNRYQLLASGTSPFVIDGTIDFRDMARMAADLRMTASNMLLLDAKRTPESLVYGKLLMNFNSTIKGPLSQLVMRGDAHLLGGTDVTYVFTESPLTVQDRMEGLITFTSFTDTLTRQRRESTQASIVGIDMLMVLHIDPSVQFKVDLTADQSDYVQLEGGGDLSFQFNRQGDMVLNGRYTFTEGVVNYSLPVVPLKTFNIHSGSYVQWDGEVMNPLINVKATERMRATVNGSDGGQRRVNFDVGISVQEHLDNMQMSFIIDAEDSGIKSELSAMGEDERSRQAVFMMVTGTYLESGGASNMNIGGALSNFLVGEINNIAGDALKDVDIDVGLETYDGTSGSQTDLTFSFAKRFYNDRIRLSIGGKVSTSGNVEETQSFLDNFAAEYMLDPAGTKTIKLFYDRNYESLLDGEVVETGIGLVFRKKVLRLGELFDFRKKRTVPVKNEDAAQEDDKPVAFINNIDRRMKTSDEYEQSEN